MSVLDPDDQVQIELCRKHGMTFVTWDRPVREAANGITPYEAMEQAVKEGIDSAKAEVEKIKLLLLSPKNLTVLADSADKTIKAFQKHIKIDMSGAMEVRFFRVERGYSWRSIARWAAVRFKAPWGSNQLAGMVICEKAAAHFGEDFMEAPWN